MKFIFLGCWIYKGGEVSSLFLFSLLAGLFLN